MNANHAVSRRVLKVSYETSCMVLVCAGVRDVKVTAGMVCACQCLVCRLLSPVSCAAAVALLAHFLRRSPRVFLFMCFFFVKATFGRSSATSSRHTNWSTRPETAIETSGPLRTTPRCRLGEAAKTQARTRSERRQKRQQRPRLGAGGEAPGMMLPPLRSKLNIVLRGGGGIFHGGTLTPFTHSVCYMIV